MRGSSFRNRMTTSSVTLPVVLVLASLLWVAGGMCCGDSAWQESWNLVSGRGIVPEGGLWNRLRLAFSEGKGVTDVRLWTWAVCVLTTYVWMDVDSRYSIVRVRNRFTPALYIGFMGVLFFLHASVRNAIASLCMLAAYAALFQSYQNRDSSRLLFRAFLCLGVGSFFWVQLLCFVPFFFLYTLVYLRSLTWRAFWAGVVGLVLPYWLLLGWCLYSGDLSWPVAHLAGLAQWEPVDMVHLLSLIPAVEGNPVSAEQLSGILRVATVGLLLLAVLVASLHCIRTNYNDKIRTRMLLHILLAQELLLVVFLVLQPCFFDVLSGLLAMSSAPVLSHYFVLAKGRIADFFFMCVLLAWAASAVCNLWCLWMLS